MRDSIDQLSVPEHQPLPSLEGATDAFASDAGEPVALRVHARAEQRPADLAVPVIDGFGDPEV